MTKLLLLLIFVGFGLLVISGVVEVSVNPDDFSNLSQVIRGNTNANVGTVGTIATKVKRRVEIFFTERPEGRLEKRLQYVEEDANNLNTAMEDAATDPQDVLSQAELLAESVNNAQEQAEALEAAELATMEDRSREVLDKAKSTLEELQKVRESYQLTEQQLSQIINSTKLDIEELEPTPTTTPKPADETSAEDDSTSYIENTVPLRF